MKLKLSQLKPICIGAVILLLLFLIVGGICEYFESGNAKRVLVIQSYDENYPTNDQFNKAIREAFKNLDTSVEFKTVYLDCERYNNDEELFHMNELLDSVQKQQWEPDVILVNDDQGCFSFLSCGHPWSNDKPVVFGGVNFPNKGLLASHPNVTGFHDEIELDKNFKLIDEFQRRTSPYYYTMLFLDSTYLEKKARKQLQEFVESHAAEYDYMDRNTLIDKDDDFELVKTYSPAYHNFIDHIKKYENKINIFSTRVRKSSGANLMWNCTVHEEMGSSYLKITANISTETAEAFCQMPKFSAINEKFGAGRNYIAGYMTTFPIQAREMAGAAVEIFKGKSPKDMPIQKSRKEYVADWKALQHFDLDYRDFDDKCRIVNMPFYVRYRWWLIPLAVIFVIWNIHTLIYLQIHRTKERKLKERAQAELAEKNKELIHSLAQLKEQYEELQKVRKMVEKAELKQSFLDSMSHEIRTPLNAIVGFSNLLVDEATATVLSDGEKHEFMTLIQRNTELLLKLVNDILEISRIESGNIPINLTHDQTQRIVAEIFDEHKILIQNKTFLLENDHVESDISIDPTRFKQVIANLLNNANKFTESGEIVLGCRYNKDDNTEIFYVRDTGIGIEKEEQSMIFRRFYKIDPFTQGTGLGLSISMTIIEKMHGSLKVESELGKGSTFFVTIPAVAAFEG